MPRRLTQAELFDVLERHKKWVYGEPGGEQADLSLTDLRGVRLLGTMLRGANLMEADLREAILAGADMRGICGDGADFSDAMLRGVRRD